MHGRFTALLVAVGAGLGFGAFGALGQAHFEGTLDAFANSISTWLVAAFVVGALATTGRRAALAGFAACAFQLLGYYAVNAVRDVGTTSALVAFWSACAVVGGPLFGLAGHTWRRGPAQLRGLGTAALAGAFVAEGLYAYAHQLQQYVTGALWVTIGVALALWSSREHPRQLRWLALTVPLGVAGEAALTSVLHRFL